MALAVRKAEASNSDELNPRIMDVLTQAKE